MLTVRTNGMSTFTCNQLNRVNNCLKTSLERLSTGYRINSAKDDAANLSISTGMECQISGTGVAKDNTQQGMNLLGIADGALGNMTNNAERIRDLCLQSMNGTYSDEERQMMQAEVEQLTREIYREKNSAAYNQIKLFYGGLDESYEKAIATDPTEEPTPITESHDLPKEYQELTYIKSSGTQWIDTGVTITNNTKMTCVWENVFDADGNLISVNSENKAWGGNVSNYGLDAAHGYNGGGRMQGGYISYWMGVNCTTSVKVEDTIGKSYTDILTNENNWTNIEMIDNSDNSVVYDATVYKRIYSSAQNIYLFRDNTTSSGNAYPGVKKIYSFKFEKDGNLVRDLVPCYRKSDNVAGMYDKVSGTFFGNKGTGEFVSGREVPGDPAIVDLQVGANSGEDNVLSVTTGFLLNNYIGDVSTVEKASETLTKTDELINLFLEQRSNIGASQNRLESVLSSQETKIENLSESNSNIKDTDFAKETANLTKYQILQNMVASLIAQANTTPQLALSLL